MAAPTWLAVHTGTAFSARRGKAVLGAVEQLGSRFWNSVDAVSDRDWVAELAFAGALVGVHLSRLGEDLMFFGSTELGFVRLADAYSTGSSLMPQKRNPDAAELVRGKTARVPAALATLLSLTRGLPMAYNRDLQEDKAPRYDAGYTTNSTVYTVFLTGNAVDESDEPLAEMRARITVERSCPLPGAR